MQPSTATTLRGLRVLIVDDNAIDRILVSRLLKEWQMEADLAADCADALAMIREASYDAVLIDDSLPGPDGQSTAEMIRSLYGGGSEALNLFRLSTTVSGAETPDGLFNGTICKIPLDRDALYRHLSAIYRN